MGRHAAAALNVEKDRLAKIGGALLGICGDANHSFGFHLPASELPASDYSRKGKINAPDDWTACCAIDIGMDWKASRDWLRWLIKEKQAGRLKGVIEVIGSYDGKNVRYWSWLNTPSWPTNGEKYTGSGHDRWTHVSIARSMTKKDHGILKGWSANGYQGGGLPLDKKDILKFWNTDDVLESKAMGYGDEYSKKNPAMAVKTVLQLLRRDQRTGDKKIDTTVKKVDAIVAEQARQATELAEIKQLIQGLAAPPASRKRGT